MDIKALKLLARDFPTVQAVSTEIINLSAICSLPKGTEQFMSDLHGEHRAFLHIMNNCSGVIREKIEIAFANSLGVNEKNELARLVYYPEAMLERTRAKKQNTNDWYAVMLTRLVEVCHAVTHKYTRSKIRKAMPKDFAYIIDELLHKKNYSDMDRTSYYESIIMTIIRLDRADEFIKAMCDMIKCMAVDHLHIVGDIFDRGPHADVIIERLKKQHSLDIQWGNHDVLWMGAAAGSDVCIATVLKNCLQYDNLDMLEYSYGISLLPLASFASDVYKDTCEVFNPRVPPKHGYTSTDSPLYARMHKAMCVIMFKLEGQLIERNPQFHMEDRNMLKRINYADMTLEINGTVYKLRDSDFPTIDPACPNKLTAEEEDLIRDMREEFEESDKLHNHIDYLYKVGGVYTIYNNNLLYHGCMPTNEDGSFTEFVYDGKKYKGKALFDYADMTARKAFYSEHIKEKQKGRDFMWYLWCGRWSPIFGKNCITTFERTLIADKETWNEPKNPYYKWCNEEAFCEKILDEFDVDKDSFSHIVNGHIPVKAKNGEDPRRANGRLMFIDGGFCRAYQGTTGIAGYTMFFTSKGLRLASHEPYKALSDAEMLNEDIKSNSIIFENSAERILVADTDTGKELKEQISVLTELLQAYRTGRIKEAK